MKIDWFTFFAQIANFLILVALLHHFLYKRILRVMEERQARIRDQLDQAKQREEEAGKEIQRLRQQHLDLEKRKESLLADASEEVRHWKTRQLQQAKSEIEQRKHLWYESLANEKTTFLKELRHRIVQMTCKLARGALAEMADTQLEQRLVEVFLKKLDSMDPREAEAFQNAIEAGRGLVQITASLDLPGELSDSLQNHLKRRFPGIRSVEFKKNLGLAVGIEVTAYDRKVSWSLEEYLTPLENHMNGFLETSTQKTTMDSPNGKK